MAAETIAQGIEIYRFKEDGLTYSSLCILLYKEGYVLIKGLPSKVDLQDIRELKAYLISKGITSCKYERRKEGKTLYKKWIIGEGCNVEGMSL